jgi:hypothetical protein
MWMFGGGKNNYNKKNIYIIILRSLDLYALYYCTWMLIKQERTVREKKE